MVRVIKKININARKLENILAFIILLVYLRNFKNLNCITIVGDEFGYWANAATFLGYDWKAVGELNPYYSFGYSFILLPILFIFETNNAYKFAILVNIFFVIISFFLLNKILISLKWNINVKFIYLISFAVSFYPNLYFQTLTTQSECLLYFLYCLLVYFTIKIEEEYKIVRICIFNLVLFYTYMVHMRNIGIVLVGIGVQLLILSKFQIHNRKKIVWTFSIIVITLISIILTENIKAFLIQNLYQSNIVAQTNTYSGQIGKLNYICSLEGIHHLITSFLGKLYYFGVSTFLVGYVGLYEVVKKIILQLKDRNINIVYVFIFLSFLSQIVIDAVYMIYPTERLDTLIYGRYFEHVIGPIVGIGVLSLLNSLIKGTMLRKNIIYIYFMFLVTLFITYIQAIKNEIKYYYPGNAVTLVKIGTESQLLTDGKLVYLAGILAILLFTLIIVAFSRKRFSLCILTIVLIGLVWLEYGDYVVKNTTVVNQKKVEEIIEVMKEIPVDCSIYFINESLGKFNHIDYVQFIDKYREIKVISDKELSIVNPNDYVIAYPNTPMSEYLESYCENFYFTSYLNFFEYNIK